MARKIRVADLPEFDPAERLRSDEDIAAYLNAVIEAGDMAELSHVLPRGSCLEHERIAKASGIIHKAK